MIEVEVWRKTRGAKNVSVLELRAVDGAPLPAFCAGAHINVEIASGLVRQYSLCNRPGTRDHYRIAILHEAASRGGSAAMARLSPGARLRISAPLNLFPLARETKSARLIAGGIGITPILAMARQLWDEATPFRLWYAARSRAAMAFRDEIAKSAFASLSTLHADDEAGCLLDLATALSHPRPGEHLYVCGPGAFIDAVLDMAGQRGWPVESLHREHFSAAPAPGERDNQAFTLRLARSGREIDVPADRSALEALVQAGVEIEFSCEQGVCGSCITPVLSGVPDHRDLFMGGIEHAANDRFTPCCSRAVTPVLEIDL